MVGRRSRASVLVGSLLLGGSAALAQGTLTGDLLAGEVAGYLVIACFADAELGCDEDRSAFAAIEATGTRATWSIQVGAAGPFLLLAWLDADGDGDAQDHELVVLLDDAGEPALVTAPAAGLVLRGPGAPAAASGAPGTRNPAVGGAPDPAAGAAAPLPTTGSYALPSELVGVWQQTRASGGDYRDLVTGSTFSMTSGFATVLKLRADGGFEFRFYSSGTAPDCAFVSTLDTSVGTARYQDGTLVLWPAERTIENTNCTRSGRHDLDPEPIRLAVRYTEGFDRENHRMWTLALDGGPVPLQLTLLHRPPATEPPRPAWPADFALGSDSPYDVLQGVWSANHHSDLGFFDPATDAWYLPESSGAKHLWVRFTPGGYDLARAWPDYSFGQGFCGKDYVYYERGRADLSVIEARGESSYRGHARFVADDARLIVNLRNCGDDDGATQYALTPQTSYYEWVFGAASNAFGHIPATLSLQCPWELSEWQFMVCDGSSPYGASLTPR